MKALLVLTLFLVTSCSTYPSAGRSRTIFGRIVSAPLVEIWVGHVTAGGTAYEVALEPSGHRLVGLMVQWPAGQCPYNGRPREQVFRIAYAVSWDRTVVGGVDQAWLPPHLMMTRLFVLRCEPVGAGVRPSRRAAADAP